MKSARRAARAPFRRAVPPQGRGQVPIVRGTAVVEAPVNVLYLPAEVAQARLAAAQWVAAKTLARAVAAGAAMAHPCSPRTRPQ